MSGVANDILEEINAKLGLLVEDSSIGVFSEAETTTTPSISQELISITVPALKIRLLRKVEVSCRMNVRVRITADGAIIGSGRTGPDKSNMSFTWTPSRPISAGKVIKVIALSMSGQPGVDIEAYLQATDLPA